MIKNKSKPANEKLSQLRENSIKLSYPKYTWVGNRISNEDMERLYRLKQTIRKPITIMVAEAVREYVIKQSRQKEEKEPKRLYKCPQDALKEGKA